MDHLREPRGSGTVIRLIAGRARDDRPLAAALGRHLRQLIFDGSLRPGERLPSSRTLARELGCARGTVETTYGDLDAEGLIARRSGSGSFVSPSLGRLEGAAPGARRPKQGTARLLSARGAAVARLAPCLHPLATRPFTGSVPDLREFPWALWRRLWSEGLRAGADDLTGYSDPQGLLVLRRALARWLRLTRGIACRAEQILVLHSAQQALALSATLLFDRGERVALEDPGYPGALAALTAAGLRPVPIPVDGDGVMAQKLAGKAGLRGLYLTPSHQNPLGVTLSLARRLELIAWASETGAWIIEDDFDGGVSYDHRPIAALSGLDSQGRTLYLGSSSKLIFPGLRLAWLVLPEPLVAPFTTLRANLDGHSPALAQACLARFIDDGHLARHIRRMTGLYRVRRDRLLGQIERINRAGPRPVLAVRPANAGLKLAVELTNGANDLALAARARDGGLELPTLSTTYGVRANARHGFILGYGALTPAEIDAAAGRLQEVLSP